jgi:hypothetical protein
MADSKRPVWTVGGLSRDDAGWAVSNARELGEDEFMELERKIAFVLDLASQRDYNRLLAAVARFDALVAAALEELATERQLSQRSAAALPLDLAAIAEAARRLETALAEKVDAAVDLPPHLVDAFCDVRHSIRASGPYLLAYEMSRRAAASDLTLVLRDGAVHFEGTARHSAGEIARGLLGILFSLVGAYLNVFRARFEEVAAELEREAAAVTDGSPCLISYHVGGSGPEQLQLKDIPLEEIAALRYFYVEASAARRPEELVQAALALARATIRTDLHIGEVDVAAGLVGGGAAEGVNQLPTAKLELDLRLLGSTPLDYWGPLHYGVGQGGYERELFAGAVQSVSIEKDRVVLDCEGAVNLVERGGGGTLASGLSQAELVRSLLLATGVSVDALPFDAPAPEQAEEEFEVLLPIHGISVDAPLALGGVEIVPVACGEVALDGLEREGEIATRLRAAFADAESYGRAVVRAATVPGAEEAGVSAIESAVAWIVTRGRYGFARLPDGHVQPFRRQESLRAPQIEPVVLVRGTATGRRWLRSQRIENEPITRALEQTTPLLNPQFRAELAPEERHALLALRRATSEAVLETQLQALWEAIEFYAAGAKVEKLFTRAELKRLRESRPAWLNADQKRRFGDAINDLNSPPLSVRLTLQLEQDGVPLTENERDLLLTTLRRARNRPTHGKVPDPPTRAEIHHGISIVARMLVYRIARGGSGARTSRLGTEVEGGT